MNQVSHRLIITNATIVLANRVMVDGNVQWITTSSNPKSHTQTGCVCNGSIGNRANGASDPTLACAGKMRLDDVKEDPETLFVHSVSPTEVPIIHVMA